MIIHHLPFILLPISPLVPVYIKYTGGLIEGQVRGISKGLIGTNGLIGARLHGFICCFRHIPCFMFPFPTHIYRYVSLFGTCSFDLRLLLLKGAKNRAEFEKIRAIVKEGVKKGAMLKKLYQAQILWHVIINHAARG